MQNIEPNGRKKVLLAITKSNWGGAQRYVFDLATSLPKDRFDVVVAFGEGGMLEERLREAGIRTIMLSGLGRDISTVKDITIMLDLAHIIALEKPDIVHSNSSKMGGIGAFAARIEGVTKIVFTVHGFAFNERRGFLATQAIRFASWLTLFLGTDAIFVSESDMAQASHWPLVGKRHLVHNGISSPAFASRAEARTELIRLTGKNLDGVTVIGSIGELNANKGYAYALDALAEVLETSPTPLHYVVFSEGEDRMKLEALIAAKKLGGHVTLAGFVDQGARYLSGFDIFLMTSQKEGLPYVILEAGHAKLPVIATRVGGIPEIITDSTSGLLIPPRDSAAIATALNVLLQNPHDGSRYGEALYEKVRGEFSKERMVAETIKAYEA